MPVKTYFITGATGTFGSAIVPLLLRDRDVHLRLLIRARDQQHLAERMHALCQFWDLRYEDIRHRVKAIQGDMALEHFGLDQHVFKTLARECTHIIHCAGVVRMNLPLQEARSNALDAAKNICELAEACQQNGILKKIEFVSTVGVAGRLPGLLPETWLTKPRTFHNTYEQAKAEAEEFISQKVKEGMPLTLHRPSMVVGDSVTGKIIHFQVFYHLCEFLSGSRTFGIVPRLHGVQLDTIPVDFVAAVIIKSSRLPEWAGKVLHLCSGPEQAIEILTLTQMVREIFLDSGRKLPRQITVPLSFFRSAISLLKPFVSPKSRRALNSLPYFFEYLKEKQSFANGITQGLLESEGINVPEPAGYIAPILINYLKKKSSKDF